MPACSDPSHGPTQAGVQRDQQLLQPPTAQGEQSSFGVTLQHLSTPKDPSLGDLPGLTNCSFQRVTLPRSKTVSDRAPQRPSLEHAWPEHPGDVQRLDGEIYEGEAFTITHRLPELPLPTSCHHLLPAHRATPGMGLSGQVEESFTPFIVRERKEQRGAGSQSRKAQAQAGLHSATRGLPGSILNAVWQIYAG